MKPQSILKPFKITYIENMEKKNWQMMTEKFDDVHKKPGFRFLPEKCHP